jgi:Uma2 family endonuclease
LIAIFDDGTVVVEGRMGRRTSIMAPAPPLMTTDDYFREPETLLPAELAYGVMHVADAPSPRHQSAVADLFRALDRHVNERDLGRMWLAPLDVVLDAEQSLIVQPDLLFISKAREVIVRDRVRGAPDLVIEVLSPNPRIGRTVEHMAWFAAYGVRESWWVDTTRRDVTVMSFDERRVQSRRTYAAAEPMVSRVLPEWSMRLDDLLRR